MQQFLKGFEKWPTKQWIKQKMQNSDELNNVLKINKSNLLPQVIIFVHNTEF